MSLDIRLLGAPEIVRDASAIRTDRRKAVALLAYLAVTGRSHTRDALAALLWPDYESSSAYAYLRRTLWELRQQIGDGWLVVDRSRAALPARDGLFLDVAALEQGLSNAARPDEVERALSLYRGPFLEGFTLRDAAPFDEWQRLEEQRLRLLHLAGRERLARDRWEQGEPVAALSAARALVAADPLHEPGQRLLVELLARSGDRAGALRQYESFAGLLADELNAAPGAASTELYEAVRTGGFPPAAPTATSPSSPLSEDPRPGTKAVHPAAAAAPGPPPAGTEPQGHRLPAGATPFVGRETLLAELAHLLAEPGQRLITLTGPGGSGKTRLALEAAARNEALFADGICFVPLAGTRAGEAIIPAIIQALQLPLRHEATTSDAQAQLLEFLTGRQMLLVLDNFEQLVEPGGGPVLADLLAATPRSTFLVTSRIRLNLRAEQLLPVGGLQLPPPDTPTDRLPDFSAVTLFVQSARRLQPDFAVDDDNAAAIVDICTLLDGAPLAIELAASWITLLPPAEIAAEIRNSLEFLETELQDVPARQRSLSAVFDSTWQLLSAREQAIFPRLALFPAGFSREAAVTVAGAGLRDLLGLTNKSLLRREENGRYVIHELLRQFGEERLHADTAAWTAARQTLVTCLLDLVVSQVGDMKGPRQRAALDIVAGDIENIRQAWEWACELGHFDLMLAAIEGLGLFFSSRGQLGDLGAMTSRALTAADAQGLAERDPVGYGELMVAHAAASSFRFHFYDSTYHEAAIAHLHMQGLDQFRTFLILMMIMVLDWPRQMDDTRWLLDEGLALARRRGEKWEEAGLLDVYGEFLRYTQRPREALQHLAQGYEIARELGNESLLARLRRSMAELAREHGNHAEATRLLKEALARHQSVGDSAEVGNVFYRLGDNEVGAGRYEAAIDYYRKGHDAFKEAGYHLLALDILSWAATCLLRLGRLDEALALRYDMLERGDILQTPSRGWYEWDIGEVLRVAGDSAAAREWYERSRPVFARLDDPMGEALVHRGLGDLALMLGRLAEARRELSRSRDILEELLNVWGVAYASCSLGRVAIAEEAFDDAQRELSAGLQKGLSIGDQGLMTIALTGLAELALAEGAAEHALVLSGFIQAHHATWYEFRQVAARVEVQAGRQVSPTVARRARDRGAALSADEAIAYARRHVLHEGA